MKIQNQEKHVVGEGIFQLFNAIVVIKLCYFYFYKKKKVNYIFTSYICDIFHVI
jgi:hypothetical protein